MSALIQTLIGGLTVTGLTGLTILAYKKPDEYGRLSKFVVTVVTAAILMVVAYSVGIISSSSSRLAEDLERNPEMTLQDVDFAIQHMNEVSDLVVKVGGVGFLLVAYVIFLSYLPRILGWTPAEDTAEPSR